MKLILLYIVLDFLYIFISTHLTNCVVKGKIVSKVWNKSNIHAIALQIQTALITIVNDSIVYNTI